MPLLCLEPSTWLSSRHHFTRLSTISRLSYGLKALPDMVSHCLFPSVYSWHSPSRFPSHSLCPCCPLGVEWLSFIYNLSDSVLSFFTSFRCHLIWEAILNGAIKDRLSSSTSLFTGRCATRVFISLLICFFSLPMTLSAPQNQELCICFICYSILRASPGTWHNTALSIRMNEWANAWVKHAACWDEESIVYIWLGARNQMSQRGILIRGLWKNVSWLK